PAAIVSGPNVRFTVLTSRLIRLEYSTTGIFEDNASQVFWYRHQPVPPFKAVQAEDQIDIETEHLHLRYKITPNGFTRQTLTIELRESGTVWHYGERDRANLGGTARTLDEVDGHTRLSQGLLSRSGWSLVDDSTGYVFDADGWLAPRAAPGNQDLYFFGYGNAYLDCLRDFCRVGGAVPLIPRWALGNWWSRYWAYTQAEFEQLIRDFKARDVPLAVAIIDMDWHITKTGNESSGWTGYTWNRALFPDASGILKWLHEQGLKVALNLHPAEGVHPHEDRYPEMARRMGIDPSSQAPVPFDIADPRFTQVYFDVLHHPMEEQGVDFWWMDWQQGVKVSRTARPELAGLDPLFWLNHLHFHDLGRKPEKRPFMFSRWPGLGSRYAIGFSGDSVVSWKSLAFQPRFTATASNVVFPWWSHDIGGHMQGVEDPELYTRWVQLGVFSPILRLHSTANPYHDRRPWAHGAEVLEATRAALQLRHALIPYLYTMTRRCTVDSKPLIMPMYYLHAGAEDAYNCPNQYYYGSELIAAPYITPRNPETRLSRQPVWLPEGDFFDFFSGVRYHGGDWRTFYGDLGDIPVLARAGAIIPLGPKSGEFGVALPGELTVAIFPGADNVFELYEDDGESQAYLHGASCVTRMEQNWHPGRLEFRIAPVKGDTSVIPAERHYQLVIRGVSQPDEVSVRVNGQSHPASIAYDKVTETLSVGGIVLAPGDELLLTAVHAGDLLSQTDHRPEDCRRLLRAFRLETNVKHRIDRALPQLLSGETRLAQFSGELSDAQLQALSEVLR
ncbi:MAG TPA: TIM-barrel domain-containing protein, partial [Anaerolineae bacterium]